MLADQKSAEDINTFLDLVREIRRNWDFPYEDPFGPWFRGQQRSYWSPTPGLYRHYIDHPELTPTEIEDEIREEFMVRAPILSDTKPAGNDDWEWYFIMQHYGAPTRLLDWTEGALLGLYFAVRDNPGFYDAAVWMLDPYELNSRVIGTSEVIPPSAPNLDKSARRLVSPWLPSRFKKGSKLRPEPVAILPTHIARRISTQRSCFTIHGSNINGLEKFQRAKDPCVSKVVIPSDRTQAIRRELEGCGIDEATIFPDLDGLGRSLSSRWREDKHKPPHSGVYARLQSNGAGADGIGVFAITEIKKDSAVFAGENEEIVWFTKGLTPRDKNMRIEKLYEDFGLERNGRFGYPPTFNRLTMAWYLRQTKKGEAPNLRFEPDGYAFFALRGIHPDEELTVDFATIDRSER